MISNHIKYTYNNYKLWYKRQHYFIYNSNYNHSIIYKK